MKKIVIFMFICIVVSLSAKSFLQEQSTIQSSKILSNKELLWFRAGVFNPQDSSTPLLDHDLIAESPERNFGYYIVQFTEPQAYDIEQIVDSKKYYYVPNNAWVYRIFNDDLDKIKSLEKIRSITYLSPSLRIYPGLLSELQQPDSSNGSITLKVQLFQGESLEDFEKYLEQFEYTLLDKFQGAHHEYYVIKIKPELLKEISLEIAKYEGTEWLERRYPIEFHNDWSRWITQSYNFADRESGSQLIPQMSVDTDHVPVYRRGIYGQGQIVGYLDSGLDFASKFFCDPDASVTTVTGWTAPADNGHRKVRAYNRGSSTSGDFEDSDTFHGHGTHTGGSIAGEDETNSPIDGTYDQGDGMAPLARLVFTDGATATNGVYTPYDMNTLFNFARDCGANIHSNSYGSSSPNYYDSNAQELDEFMWDYRDFLIMFSAGNDNDEDPPARVATYNCSKSVVSVGASESGFGWGSTTWSNPGTSTGNNPEDMAQFSSHGPTDEGLLRPTVVAPGGWYIMSADLVDDGGDCHDGLQAMGGTSMSCPTLAGMTALVRQYFTDGYYPSGDAVSADGFSPSASLMKAMLINGTRNMTGAYTIDDTDNSGHQDAPSNGQGWGRVVLDDCMYFNDSWGNDSRRLIVYDIGTGFSTTGESFTYIIETGSSTTEPLKVVLCYADYPGSPAVGTSGVNDLDLTVEIAGNTYKGNVFASTGARSTTGGAYDQLNREEVVWLDAIDNETMVITVDASDIQTAGQPYALVITGDVYIGEPNNSPETPELSNSQLFNYARVALVSPTLEFYVPSDMDGDDIHFVVEFDDDVTFGSVNGSFSTSAGDAGFLGTFPRPEGTSELVSFTFPISLTDAETYWWRVRAYDGISYSSWTEPRSFTVDISASLTNWYQTTSQQFDFDTITSLENSSGSVSVSGETVYLEDNFDTYSSTSDFDAEWSTNGSGYEIQSTEYYSAGNALRFEDSNTGQSVNAYHSIGSVTEGYVELWSMTESSSDECFIITLYYGSNRRTQLYYRDGSVALWDGSSRHNLVDIDPGVWHHYRMDFDCTANEINITIDDTDTYGPYTFTSLTTEINTFLFGTITFNGYTCDTYFDDLKIANSSGSGEGVIISSEIIKSNHPTATHWNSVIWSQDADDSIWVVCDELVSGVWTPYDSALSSSTATAGTLSIAGIISSDTIRIRGHLIAGAGTASMHDWSVNWSNNVLGVELLQGSLSGSDYETWNLGIMAQNDFRIMSDADRVIVNNIGSTPFDVNIMASEIDWTYDFTPAVDKCVLLALFNSDALPNEADYNPGLDFVNNVWRLSGEGTDGNFGSLSADGVNILPGEYEELYFYFHTPTVNNISDEQTITVYINVIAH